MDVLNLNKDAMDSLRQEDFATAFKLLKSAESSLISTPVEDSSRLWGITLNNLGSFYKRTNQPELAIHYLKKALEIEEKSPLNSANIASTHLNLCALRGQLFNFQKALSHALRAIKILEGSRSKNSGVYTTLVIGYYNAGTMYEHLHQIPESVKCFQRGLNIAIDKLQSSHPLIKNLKNSLQGVTSLRRGHRLTPTQSYRGSPHSSRINKTSSHTRRKLSRDSKPRGYLPPLVREPGHSNVSYSSIKSDKLDFRGKITRAERKAQDAISELKALQREREKIEIKIRKFEVSPKNTLDVIPEKKVEDKVSSICLVQAWFRGNAQRRWLIQMREKAVCIQKYYKMHSTRKLFKDIKEAALCIQQFYRNYF